jgi:hypothetical protein
MSVKLRQDLERRIVNAIAQEAIRTGHTVSVFDGEEWTVTKSTKLSDIMGAIMTTDEDMLRIRNTAGQRIGDVMLIYGNDGYDVIADHHSSEAMDAILAPANELADRYF